MFLHHGFIWQLFIFKQCIFMMLEKNVDYTINLLADLVVEPPPSLG